MDDEQTKFLAAELVEALRHATEEAAERDRAISQCESSGDYFCSGEIDIADMAAAHVADVIVRLIDERVKVLMSSSARASAEG